MNQRLSLIVSILVLVFSIFLFYKFQIIEKKTNKIDESILLIDSVTEKALDKMDTSFNKNIQQIENSFANNLNSTSDEIIKKKLRKYSSELNSLHDQIKLEKANLEKIRKKKNRLIYSLPEQVDLDDVYEFYKNKSSVNFDTEKGSIYFSDIDIKVVPSMRKAAWIRIGKSESSDNAAVINAWLYEAVKEKKRNGYKLIYNRTSPSDYGEYTEKLYKKGDMYFKTYYQYIRYQGTYDSHYLRYKFYVEIGSSKRKEQYFKEQYNSKVGS